MGNPVHNLKKMFNVYRVSHMPCPIRTWLHISAENYDTYFLMKLLNAYYILVSGSNLYFEMWSICLELIGPLTHSIYIHIHTMSVRHVCILAANPAIARSCILFQVFHSRISVCGSISWTNEFNRIKTICNRDSTKT